MLAELELREKPNGHAREQFRTSGARPGALSMQGPIRELMGDVTFSVEEKLLLFEALFAHDSEGFGRVDQGPDFDQGETKRGHYADTSGA
jgi:hypothetical protein